MLSLNTNNSNLIICFKQIVRHARRRPNKLDDPGLRLTKSLFNEKQLSELGTQDIEELETDFHSVGMSYNEHVREMNTMRERQKLQIVRQRYFKQKLPNFLTWADKQQIKYLHGKDPEVWSTEKLSEGFPATPEIIKKIIKANYTKTDIAIKEHDRSVQQNWSLFKEGKIENLPEELSEHLKRFTNRALNFDAITLPNSNSPPKPLIKTGGEFAEIIASYDRLKNKNQDRLLLEDDEEEVSNKTLRETYYTEKQETFEMKTHTTLSQYKNSLQNKLQTGGDVSEIDKNIIDSFKTVPAEESKEIELNKVHFVNDSGSVSLYKKPEQYNHLVYPEKILIPKKLKKRGNTYKLNDCYYDDDGEFLYRVPGME